MEITMENDFPENVDELLPRQRERFHEKMQTVVVFITTTITMHDCAPAARSKGTGVIISKEGHILTSSRTIQNSAHIAFRRPHTNGFFDEGEAEVIHDYPLSDVAILKIKETGATTTTSSSGGNDSYYDFCKFANEEDVVIAMEVFCISSPFGFENTFTRGYVQFPCRIAGDVLIYDQARPRDKEEEELPLIQIGNLHAGSGGPVFDSKGRVIGMMTFGNISNDFAVHLRKLREILQNTGLA